MHVHVPRHRAAVLAICRIMQHALSYTDTGMHLLWTCVIGLAGPHWPSSRRSENEAMAMSLSVSYLTDLFQPAASSHMHMTRSASSGGIHLPQVKTEMGILFTYRGAHRWEFPPIGREDRQSC